MDVYEALIRELGSDRVLRGPEAVAPYGSDVILVGDGGDCVALASKVIPLSRPGRWLDPGPRVRVREHVPRLAGVPGW